MFALLRIPKKRQGMSQTLRYDRPINPQKFPFYYGWMLVISATFCMAAAVPGSPPGVSPFVEPMLEAYGISRPDFSLAYTLGTLLTGFVTAFLGQRLDRLDIRKVLIVIYALLGFSLIGMGVFDRIYRQLPLAMQTPAVAWCFLFFSFFLIRFTGMGISSTLCRSMVSRWFSERRSIAVTITSAVLSLSFNGAPAILFLVVDGFGWRSAWIGMGLVLGILLVANVYVFFRKSPEECHMQVENKAPEQNEARTTIQIGSEKHFPVYKDLTASKAMRTLTFWSVLFGISLNAFFGTGSSFHLASICIDAGLDKARAPQMLLVMGVINLAGTLIWGAISHRIDLKYALYATYLAIGLSIIGMLQIEHLYGQLLFSIGSGASWGTFGILLNLPWPRYYGRSYLGDINARVTAFVICTSAIGPYIFGLNRESTGDYATALLGCLLAVPIGLALAALSHNPQERYNERAKGS
ncbi:MAG: MFS transporter [Opitutales bacterium]|nr:MFS transporter [Opitutales bacterium]NRA26702.1 MFS transporter [Opitutales bacterium]